MSAPKFTPGPWVRSALLVRSGDLTICEVEDNVSAASDNTSEIDANADEIRKAGQDPEAIKATVRASLKAVEAIDVEAITRQALAAVDKNAMRRSMEAARAGMREAEREIERLEQRTRD